MSEWPWPRAFAWLAFLGPFFFLTYNFSNAVASARAHVPMLMFSWERHIPFLAWTIVPYWTSDILFAVSIAVCRTREEMDMQGKRLLAIQVFSIACFLAFPLRCAFERPALEGWTGELFALLGTFDQPFNQAPSLHVSLALILWACFRNHLRGAFKKVVAAYLTLVALSSLTTYQHQFIDVLTGLWAGLLVIAALPEQRTAQPAYKLTAFYLTGAIICTATAFAFRIWLLLWPGFALSMVACAYWTRNAAWLLQGPAALLMLPYTAAAWINSRLWTRGQPARNELADSVWIGRAPLHKNGMNSIVTLTPELRLKADKQVAMLDLLPPTAEQLNEAVLAIESLSKKRPTLVCCALGYSRSAVTAAAWLIAKGHANTPREALTRVQKARPQVILNPAHEACLNEWAERRLRNAN